MSCKSLKEIFDKWGITKSFCNEDLMRIYGEIIKSFNHENDHGKFRKITDDEWDAFPCSQEIQD